MHQEDSPVRPSLTQKRQRSEPMHLHERVVDEDGTRPVRRLVERLEHLLRIVAEDDVASEAPQIATQPSLMELPAVEHHDQWPAPPIDLSDDDSSKDCVAVKAEVAKGDTPTARRDDLGPKDPLPEPYASVGCGEDQPESARAKTGGRQVGERDPVESKRIDCTGAEGTVILKNHHACPSLRADQLRGSNGHRHDTHIVREPADEGMTQPGSFVRAYGTQGAEGHLSGNRTTKVVPPPSFVSKWTLPW